MMHKILNWLLGLSFLFWFVPWQGKKYFPEIFGYWHIQWPFTVLTALLTSIGFFISYREFFSRKKNTRKYAGFCVAFILMIGTQILISLSANYMFSRTRDGLSEISHNYKIHAAILSKVYAEDTPPEESDAIARAYYRMTGTIIPAVTSKGLTLINPSLEDTSEWRKMKGKLDEMENSAENLDILLFQLPIIVGIYVSSLILIFLSGTIFLTFREQKVNKTIDRTS